MGLEGTTDLPHRTDLWSWATKIKLDLTPGSKGSLDESKTWILLQGQESSSHRGTPPPWTALLWLHLVVFWSKCNSKLRAVPPFCQILIPHQVELHVSGEPVLVSGRVRRRASGCTDAGCTKQKHGTGSGGSADHQRWVALLSARLTRLSAT